MQCNNGYMKFYSKCNIKTSYLARPRLNFFIMNWEKIGLNNIIKNKVLLVYIIYVRISTASKCKQRQISVYIEYLFIKPLLSKHSKWFKLHCVICWSKLFLLLILTHYLCVCFRKQLYIHAFLLFSLTMSFSS